jgi:Pyridine nucleotide-disulphide oxidoreductase
VNYACETAVIGAGPYGLSVGAHLGSRGADFRIFGRPLDTWRTAMPKGMLLKSDGFASSLSAPEPESTLGDYCRDRDLPYHPTDIPVPLETFVDYGLDFQRRFVPDLDQRTVASLVRDGRGFRLQLDDGEEFRARQVVVAAGITHFASMPDVFTGQPADAVSHASAHHDLTRFAGQRVTVIGSGSSAVELAVGLGRVGAHPRLVARSGGVHFGSAPRGRATLVSRLRQPGSGLGPGWRSRVSCDAPDLFRYLPSQWRPEIVRRHLGPSSPWHLRDSFESSVEVMTGRVPQRMDHRHDELHISLAGSNGEPPVVVATDHVICATGYRADVHRLPFLAPHLRSELRTLANAPLLSHRFESSAPGLYFVGIAAAVTFGPLMRFMYGDEFAARRITPGLVGSRP